MGQKWDQFYKPSSSEKLRFYKKVTLKIDNTTIRKLNNMV